MMDEEVKCEREFGWEHTSSLHHGTDCCAIYVKMLLLYINICN